MAGWQTVKLTDAEVQAQQDRAATEEAKSAAKEKVKQYRPPK